jgi:hypothetical protein
MVTNASVPTPPSSADVNAKFSTVGARLSDAFRQLLDAIPDGPHRPLQLARTLGVKKDVASRVLKAMAKRDPIAVMHLMPGPEALRRFVAHAKRQSVPVPVVQAADDAVQDFDHLIRAVAGDRESLDSIISAWLPNAREKVELLCKQSVFRGMRGIKGSAAELSLYTALYHPAADGQHLDAVWMKGLFGLRRTRPGSVIEINSRQVGPDAGARVLSLDGRPIEVADDVFVPGFTTAAPGDIQFRPEGSTIHYLLADGAIGTGSAVDVLLAERQHSCLDRYNRPGNPRKRGGFAEVNVPVRELVFDTLLHEDAYPGSDATLVAFDTTLNGVADVNDPARAIDRLEISETVQSLGRGISALRIGDVPDYLELIERACTLLGWQPDEMRAYRCRIAYPVYGMQVAMVFDAPERPAAPGESVESGE